jgi:hypothetical protein
MNTSSRIATTGRRVFAVVAAGSAVLHGISLGHAPNLLAASVLAVMAVACLYCACDLWLRGTVQGWLLIAVMNLAMIAVHLMMAPGHRHGSPVVATAQAAESTAMGMATMLAALEVVVAAVELYHRTGFRAVSQSGVEPTKAASAVPYAAAPLPLGCKGAAGIAGAKPSM